MKRKYLAFFLAAVTAVSQISGTTSFAMAAETESTISAWGGGVETLTQEQDIAEDEQLAEADDFEEITPDEDAESGEVEESADADVLDAECDTASGMEAETSGETESDVAVLNLDSEFAILSIEPETAPDGLADEEDAVPQNEGTDCICGFLEVVGENGIKDFDGCLFDTESVTLTVKIAAGVAWDSSWYIDWIVGIFDDNAGENGEGDYTIILENDNNDGAYTIDRDKKQITLNGTAIQKVLNLEDEQHFNINAVVKVKSDQNDTENSEPIEVDNEGTGIQFYETRYELRDLCWVNEDVIRGWGCMQNAEIGAWIRTPEFPGGRECSATITNMTISSDDENDPSVSYCQEDGGWYLEAKDYGVSQVEISYEISYEIHTGESTISDTYTYAIDVREERFDISLTSDRDINGYTDLKPGETVTLHAKVTSEFESNEADEPDITIKWSAKNPDYVDVKSSDDGMSCVITAKEGMANKETKIVAEVILDEESRAKADWWINIRNEYFVIRLAQGESGSNYSYDLESGESISVTPTLYASSGTAPENVVWRWNNWDTDRLAITDANGKDLSTENDGTSGTSSFTLTKKGSDQTSIRLCAYEAEHDDQLAELWLNFTDQRYDIWYDNLKEGNATFFYMDDSYPTIRLYADNLADKDKYKLEWHLGTFDGYGDPVLEMKNTNDITYYTCASDGKAVTLNMPAIRAWLQEPQTAMDPLDSFWIQARVISTVDKGNDNSYICLGRTDCAEVRLCDTVYDCDFGLDLTDAPANSGYDHAFHPSTDSEHYIGETMLIYVENAKYEEGGEYEREVKDVQLEIVEGAKRAILLSKGDDDEAWCLKCLNPCTAKLSITYESLEGSDVTETILVDVQGEGYDPYVSDEYFTLYKNESKEVTAQLIHWQQGMDDEDITDSDDVTIKWEVEKYYFADEQNDETARVVTLCENDGASGEDSINSKSCTVKAMNNGDARIVLRAYRKDDNNKDQLIAEYVFWVYVQDYKLVDITNASTVQYADIGQSVELKLQLQKGKDSPYAGDVRYLWRFNTENLELKCTDKNVTVETGKSDEEDEESENVVCMTLTQAENGPEALPITITRHGIAPEEITVNVEIKNTSGEWQEVDSSYWEFQDYVKEIWTNNLRGDEYTWLYTDETNYMIQVSTSDGLIENSRYLEWTIGFEKNGVMLENYTYPEKDTAVSEGAENYTLSSDGTKLTIRDGSHLKNWIDTQKAAYEEANGEGSADALNVVADVTVKKKTGTTENPSEITICGHSIGLEVHEPYEEWEDATYTTWMVGTTHLYYDKANDSYLVTKYVENKDHPYGEIEQYELVSIVAKNLDDSEGSDPIIQVNTENNRIELVPQRMGRAQLTYTYIDDSDHANKTFTADITVVDSTYSATVSLSGDTEHMHLGETKQLRVAVKQVKSVYNEERKEWEVKRTSLSQDQYSVTYKDNSGSLNISKSGKITVIDDQTSWASVDITILIPQEGEEPYQLYSYMGISLEKEWYAFDTKQHYDAAPDGTITITPKLRYYENGQIINPNWVSELSLKIIESEGNVTSKLDQGEITINSTDGNEASATFILTAAFVDDYGYKQEVRASFWVTFCNHQASDEWLVAYWSTCSETGLKECQCSKCGLTLKTEEIAMVEHSWDSGQITTNATCQKEGVRTYTCSECGEEKTATIAKVSHQAGSWQTETAATCTTAGKEVQKCTVCGTTVNSRSTDVKGHQAGSWIMQNGATCTTGGTEVQKCTVCGTVMNSRTTEVQGHTWGSYTVTKQPTALAEGEETHSCKICGTTESRAVAKLTPTIKLTATKLTIQLKKSASIKSIVTKLASGDSISGWTTSNKKIVTVDKNGKITGKKVGNANVTVTLKSGLSAKVKVTVQKAAVATAKITVASKKVTLTKGGKTTLTPLITPITTTDKLSYTTSSKKVATVSAKGVVTAKAAGTATITIKSGKKSVKVKVTVKAIQPTKITGVPKSKTLKVGKTLTLKPSLSPKGSEATVKYSTSNKKVATVSTKGKITAKKKGTAVITVTAGKVKTTCRITVK